MAEGGNVEKTLGTAALQASKMTRAGITELFVFGSSRKVQAMTVLLRGTVLCLRPLVICFQCQPTSLVLNWELTMALATGAVSSKVSLRKA